MSVYVTVRPLPAEAGALEPSAVTTPPDFDYLLYFGGDHGEKTGAQVIFLLGVAASFALAWLLVRWLYHGRVRRAPPWDCGFPLQTPRMQDTAEGFGQPIRQMFEPFFLLERVEWEAGADVTQDVVLVFDVELIKIAP